MINNMRDARRNVRTVLMLTKGDPRLAAEIIVAHSVAAYNPGGYARYLCRAAYRELLAGES